ncbi:hypothetical protein ACFFX1_11140 [Dactylosporangium sucinum]|uniref:Uncharacterized protein n=1 Tax=Dactylosporangium sucinum TaxID=1424081 RepID=A0A917TH35_9ACTN|nr:hypothetical protein [Dactylosporangium sucinum]GGM22414.1 hypothetical protein GCM10007977_024480 [Dactylosporangium sucinum]
MSLPKLTVDAVAQLVDADLHTVCCDAALALCGQPLTGADQYAAAAAATCPLCRLLEDLGLPCGAPGCDVGEDELSAELEFSMLGTCRRCGCTDDEACPGGCSWVPDPALLGVLGTLCSACSSGGASTEQGCG